MPKTTSAGYRAWGRRFALAVALALALAGLASARLAAPVRAASTITVNTANDVLDAQGGACASITPANLLTAPGADGKISLREAICAADNDAGGPDTIAFDPTTNGTPIKLTLLGNNDDANLTGDLDLLRSMTITGNGVGVTIIDGNSTSRIFDTFGSGATSVTINVSGVTLQHGNAASGSDTTAGGAIMVDSDDTMTITNSALVNNTAGSSSNNGVGGAIMAVGTVTVTNTVLSGNTAVPAVVGGVLVGGQGGAIDNAGGNLTVTGSTLTGNTARQGGGIYNNNALTMRFSRIVGNTATDIGSGIFNTLANATATEDWWGCNAAPCGQVTLDTGSPGSVTTSPALQLTHTASPATINTNQTSTLTAGFLKDSAGGAVAVGNLGALIGLPITFNNAQLGTISSAQPAITSAGTATATFTAGSVGGNGSADATVDSQTVTAPLTINQPPLITTNPTSQGVSAGQSVSFTAAASGFPTPTVQWQVSTDGGATWNNVTGVPSTSTTLTFTAQATDNGHEYRAVFTNTVGSAPTSAATLTVTSPPAVTTQPTDQTVNAGQTATFTAAASGNPAPTVQWQISTDGGATWNDITGATNPTFTTAPTTTADNGNRYRAVFTNGVAPDATTNAATLTVDFAPTVTTDPLSQAVCSGATVSFTAAANGNPAPTVQWQVSTDAGATFTDIGGATSPTLTFATTAGERGNYYRAVFTNSVGSATSARALLIVNIPPAITTQPTDQTVNAGQSATFTTAASGLPVPTVQWQVSTDSGATWNDLPGATSPTLTFTAQAGDDGHKYRAVFTNTCGTATTAPTTLTVDTAPAITTQPTDQTVTAGQTATFTAAASGNPAPTAQWQVSIDGGATWNDIPNATSATLTFAAAASDNGHQYRAVFTNTVDSATTTAATLTVNSPPAITSANATTFTVGAAGTFTVTTTGFPAPTITETGALPSGVTFVDNGNGTATLSGTPAAGAGGTYQFTITADNQVGTPDQQSFTLTVDEAPAFTSANGATFTVGTAGTFTATASGFPAPTIGQTGRLPTGVTFVPNRGGTATLSGTPAAGTGGTYALTLTATNGITPDATQSFTLTVNEAPAVTTQPTDQRVCVGASVSFTAAASGFPAPTVQWQLSTDGGTTWNDIPKATSETLTFAAAASDSGHQYRAVFTNTVDSATTTAATLTVDVAPAVTTQPVSQTVNAGSPVTFTAAASGSPTPTVKWQVSTDGGSTFSDIGGATSPTLAFTAQASDNGHQYRAVFANTCGTATTNAATLVVNGAPVITTQPASQSASPGQWVTFTAAASGNPAPTVRWQVSANGGATWSDIPGATTTTLTVLAVPPVDGNQYRAVFTNLVGQATTNAATLTVNTGATYSGWVSLGGRLTGIAPAATSYNGALYVFARGTDNALYARHSTDGATYTPWQRLGGNISAAPTAAVHDGTLYVFARGSDDALYETHSGDGATFSTWRRLGGVLTSAPAAATYQGRLVVFAGGTDHTLYVTTSADGVAFSPWRSLGGRLPDTQADPAAVVATASGLYAYARGSDNALYATQTTDGVTFAPWHSLGGALTSGPAAAEVNGTLVVLARGSDRALYEMRSADGGATYTAWHSLGGVLTTAPAATGFQGQIYVFTAGTDDALYTQHTR